MVVIKLKIVDFWNLPLFRRIILYNLFYILYILQFINEIYFISYNLTALLKINMSILIH